MDLPIFPYKSVNIGIFFCFFFFKFYFILKLYIIVLVLPNIKMNPPQVGTMLLDSSEVSSWQIIYFIIIPLLSLP